MEYDREKVLKERGIQFTVFKCEKCGQFYEPYETHICYKKNGYKLKERDDEVPPDMVDNRNPFLTIY